MESSRAAPVHPLDQSLDVLFNEQLPWLNQSDDMNMNILREQIKENVGENTPAPLLHKVCWQHGWNWPQYSEEGNDYLPVFSKSFFCALGVNWCEKGRHYVPSVYQYLDRIDMKMYCAFCFMKHRYRCCDICECVYTREQLARLNDALMCQMCGMQKRYDFVGPLIQGVLEHGVVKFGKRARHIDLLNPAYTHLRGHLPLHAQRPRLLRGVDTTYAFDTDSDEESVSFVTARSAPRSNLLRRAPSNVSDATTISRTPSPEL